MKMGDQFGRGRMARVEGCHVDDIHENIFLMYSAHTIHDKQAYLDYW